MQDPIVRIYDIMACNVYMDFENTGLRKYQHKFLVSFYPTGGVPVPELVESITARGPGGYQVSFANQVFTGANRNGYIYDRTTNAHWYMVNLDTGFMREGRYTIDVRCKDGTASAKGREQKDGPSEALVSAYLKNRERLFASHSPGTDRPLPKDSPLTDVQIRWTSLKDVADVDAFYIYRLSQGRTSKEFDTQNLVWWDNIFVQRASDATAGRNKNGVTIGAALKPATPYVYFTEITDSNAMGETNLCVFQPHQTFRT